MKILIARFISCITFVAAILMVFPMIAIALVAVPLIVFGDWCERRLGNESIFKMIDKYHKEKIDSLFSLFK